MFRHDSPNEAAFRTEVRTWLEANLPAALRGRTNRPPPAELMRWYRALSREGWIAPHWPKQYGGMGATLNEQIIMTEELARVGAPQLPAQGLNHIGPTLIEFGTETQKAKHLPPIIAGTVIWAQGYSEPGAGSDLASLATRATLEGDHFVVHGQKIWTTWGHHSDWMFALVRTDPQAQPRHAGISFLLLDLHSPGIRIRPIRTIAGDDEFSEVFFDNVIVPAENLVGKLNDGWRIANALFGHAVELTNRRQSLGPDSSIIKIAGSELLQQLNDLMIEAAGSDAVMENPIPTDFGTVDVSTSFLQVRRATIYGGSSEIQRNIIARRVLNLPQ